MIHDARVPVTCDARRCTEEVDVELSYGYSGYSGRSGSYDSSDRSVEKTLEKHHDWIVDDGRHYCSRDCAENPDNG